jgi:NADPH2:quinone reductase
MMTKAVRVHDFGGPEVLQIEQIELPALADDEVTIRHTAIGVNLIDTYHRFSKEGQYAIARPATLGVEGAGIVEKLGNGVSGVSVGDRVAYVMALGAYSERRNIKAAQLFRLPDNVPEDVAAAGLLKGMTTHYLVNHIFPVRKGTTMLVHSAAGGVGQTLVQMARARGAYVIGTVGSQQKVDVARQRGCDEVLVLGVDDVAAQVRKFTNGRGVDVVFDSVGQDTFDLSLNCIRPLGMMVLFGQSSGPVPPINVNLLAQKGSVFLAKPTLATFMANPALRSELAEGFFSAIGSGEITVDISRRARLDDAAGVHRDLEARKTTGALILVP